ncbi:Uncharacterised protein [Halioglobus japonicus]|nr:Uncharacterised protein [Halioglobus japonicus]
MITYRKQLWLIRTLALGITALIISSCSSLNGTRYGQCNPDSGGFDGCKVTFEVEAFSLGDPSGVYYYIVLDDKEYSDDMAQQLIGYASYVLRYRGLVEAMYEEQAEYLVVVSYGEMETNNDQQYFQLTAGSKRIYETLGEFRASWSAASIHQGKAGNEGDMLALHALAIREYAGLYIDGPSHRAYDPYSKVVKNIRKEVDSFIEKDKALGAK